MRVGIDFTVMIIDGLFMMACLVFTVNSLVNSEIVFNSLMALAFISVFRIFLVDRFKDFEVSLITHGNGKEAMEKRESIQLFNFIYMVLVLAFSAFIIL